MLLNTEQLEAVLAAHEVDALVASSPENVTYSSGYWALSQWIRRGPQTYVILPRRDLKSSCIVASSSLLDLIADDPEIWVTNVRRYGYFQADRADGVAFDTLDRRQIELYDLPDDGGPIEALTAELRAAGLSRGRIALDELGLLPGHWERLRDHLPDATLVPGAGIFRRIRSIKTADEISRLRRAAEIAERSIEASLSLATEGISELELARAFHRQTVAEDALPVLGCIGFGARSAMPNVQPSPNARLRHREVIRFDVGGRYRHYRADVARIAVLGDPDAKTALYQRALHYGVQRGLEIIRPGVRTSEVFEAVVSTVRREGIQHYARSHVGHGIGIDGYDLPDLSPSCDHIIEVGMVVCVETPYYEVGWCGLQVEDTVVVRADGPESFMKTSGALMRVGA